MKMPKLPKIFSLTNTIKKAPYVFENGVNYILTEKIDGSQFRILLTNDDWDVGSRNIWGKNSVSSGMFRLGKVRAKQLWERWKDSGLPQLALYTEFMNGPKHNLLSYDRAPKNNLYLFAAKNIDTGEWYKEPQLVELANKLEIEPPNVLGVISNPNEELLNRVIGLGSILGGVMEGVVMTAYDYDAGEVWGESSWRGFPLKVKYVSPQFREVKDTVRGKNKRGKLEGQTIDDIVKFLLDKYVTEARLHKVKRVLQEKDEYTGTTKDIGPAIREYWEDLVAEEYDNIVEDALRDIMKKFKRGIGRRVSKMVMQMDW